MEQKVVRKMGDRQRILGESWVVRTVRRLRQDKEFRLRVSLFSGAAVNFLFVGFELYGGIFYQSEWFTALVVYYAVLTVVKLYIGLCMKRGNREREWRQFRAVGLVMTILNLALTVMISVMIADPSIAMHDYGTVVAIAMACWTFYLVGSAVVSLVRLRGSDDAMRLASRMVKLVAAVVSLLMLQTALIASFGTHDGDDLIGDAVDTVDAMVGGGVTSSELAAESAEFLGLMNRVTGVAVGLFILGVTIYMIVRGTYKDRWRKMEGVVAREMVKG